MIIYWVWCQSMHRTVYSLGYFESRTDAEKVLNAQERTASGPSYGIDEIQVTLASMDKSK